MIRVLVLVALLLPGVARAVTQAEVAAQQAGGLFVQSCVAFAGAPAALRAWAGTRGVPVLADPGQAGFLKGAAGIVYDASNPAGKYVVVSLDDGGCLVLAEAVDPAELVRATEAALADAAIQAMLHEDRPDADDKGLRHRTYHAVQGSHGWTLVISVGPGMPDQAMLSAAPR